MGNNTVGHHPIGDHAHRPAADVYNASPVLFWIRLPAVRSVTLNLANFSEVAK